MRKHFATVDLRNRNAVEILFKALKVSKRMTGNPYFPNEDMSAFNASVEKLKRALGAYDGSPLSLEKRRTAEREVANEYRHKACHVNVVAKGDSEIILSSGYDLNRKKTRVYVTEAPVMKRYIKSTADGQVKIWWLRISQATKYSIYLHAEDQPDVVLATHIAMKTSYTLRGLESGKRYIVRVQARCRRNEGPLSIGQMIYEVW